MQNRDNKQRYSGTWRMGLSLLLCLFSGLSWWGCAESMPDGQGAPSSNFKIPDQRDFGAEVFKLIRREASLHQTLSQQRVQGVDALNSQWNIPSTINALVPPNALNSTEAFMRSLLGMYDDDTIPALTREGAQVLGELAETPTALQALVLSDRRTGMSPKLKAGEGGFLLRILDFPQQRELLLQLTQWYLQHDGYSDDGSAAIGEDAVLRKLFDAFALKLLNLVSNSNPGDSSMLNDILLLEDPRLDLKVGVRCAVRMDAEGNPRLSAAGKALASKGATLPSPFPGGQAQVGPCGEALTQDGQPLYEVRNLSLTVLGSLLRVGRELILRDLPLKSGQLPFPFNLPVGIRPLLGALSAQGTFSDQGPVIQALRASIKLMKGPKLYEIIQLLARISEKEEPQLAALLALFDQINEISKQHKSSVNSGNTMFEDLLPFLQEIAATPGMLEDLLKALQTPGISEKMKQGMTLLMRFKKPRITEQDYIDLKAGNLQAIFATRVDHALPDTGDNISLFQRLMHLMHDFNRLAYVSKIKALGGIDIPFIEMRIDNMALMYIRALLGELSIWETIYVNGKPIEEGVLKEQFKNSLPHMGLGEKPTPTQLAVFVNRELKFKQVPLLGPIKVDLTLDPVKCKEGHPVISHHGDALLAALGAGLVGDDGGALKPIAQVFAKHKMLPRLLDLFALFHRHWGSAANSEKTIEGKATYPTPTTNMRSTEPFVLDLLEKTDLLDRLDAFGKVMLQTTLSDQPNAPKGIDPLQRYLSFVVGAPNTARKDTPIQPLFDAFEQMDKALEGPTNQRARDAWQGALDALSDLLLQIEGKGDQARFKNQRAPIVLTRVLYYLAEDIKKKDLAGQWSPDLSRIQRDLEELFTDPILPHALNTIDALIADRKLLELTTQFLTHALPNPQDKPEQFGEFLLLTGGLMAPSPDDISVPLGRFLGQFLQKRQPMLTRVMAFLKRSIPLDTQDQLTALLRRGVVAHTSQNATRIGFFPELMRTMYRLDPTQQTTPTIDDYRSIFIQTALYLTDKQRGLEQLYQVIKQRNGPIQETAP